jgi:hypothetical protein
MRPWLGKGNVDMLGVSMAVCSFEEDKVIFSGMDLQCKGCHFGSLVGRRRVRHGGPW